DASARGKLALCSGYVNLIQNPKLPKASQSKSNFEEAATRLPRSPDPHLALARLYIYSFRNVGLAMAELHEAEQAGYKPGPREQEQRADAYLFHAEWAADQAQRNISYFQKRKWLIMARSDLERARGLYEPIDGFSNVSISRERLYRDGVREEQLRAALDDSLRGRRQTKRTLSSRRWQ